MKHIPQSHRHRRALPSYSKEVPLEEKTRIRIPKRVIPTLAPNQRLEQSVVATIHLPTAKLDS